MVTARPFSASGSPFLSSLLPSAPPALCLVVSPMDRPSTHNPVLSGVWLWQFPGEVRGGGWG